MGEADGQGLQECLAQLHNGIEEQKRRQDSLKMTVASVESMVGTFEEKLTTTATKISTAHEKQYQELDLTIHKINEQVQELGYHMKKEIAEISAEIRSMRASMQASSSPSSPFSVHPSANNTMNSCQLFNTPSSHESPSHFPPQRAIVVQPPMPAPIFSGKANDKPRPFLLQLTKYTNSTYGWDKETLFQNIGQFLKETALEWYTQVSTSTTPPSNWDTFQNLFLQQFSSPLRLAQLEQEWKTCVQKPDESINEFLVRLRTLWTEHKPHQTEHDLVRHLFAKVRPELVSLIGVLNDPTLENFLERARAAEAIEFSRLKQSSQAKELLSASSSIPVKSTRPRRSNIVCYTCNTPGHTSPNCPYNKHPTPPQIPQTQDSKNY